MGRTDTSLVDALERDEAPAWLWDVGRQRMAWANTAAVAYWKESSPFDLIDRLFSPAEIAGIEFGQTFKALESDQEERISVILFPTAAGTPADAVCRRHKLPDGRTGLLVQLIETADDDADRVLPRIRAALENLPGLVSVFGADGKVLLESDLSQDAFGDYGSLPDRIGNEAARDFFADLFDRGIAHITCDVATAVGPRRHRISGKRMTDPVTGFAAAITLFVDVTDRLALEDRTQPSAPADPTDDQSSRPDGVFDMLAPIPVGIVLLDDKGDIVFANRAAGTLAASAPDALNGQNFGDLARPPSPYPPGLDAPTPSTEDRGRQLIKGDDLIVQRPNGDEQRVRVTLAPLPDSEHLPAFIAVLEDVSAHHTTLGVLMKELEAAKQESAQKSQFLANVGHELRTPLNAIIGFSEVMRDQRLGPIENSKYRQYAKDIHHSGHLLLSLINDLLDLSKVQAGKLKLDFADINLRTIVEQCVRLVQPQAQKKEIRMRLDVPPVLPLVKADARSLEQVVLNLLTNAIKFTQPSGEVAISIATGKDGKLDLRVKDTGIGMSPDELERALKPFEQIDSTVARGEKGTGLGLPLAKALAEANRAQFTINSVPDEGTSVGLRFPATEALG